MNMPSFIARLKFEWYHWKVRRRLKKIKSLIGEAKYESP